ncbi:MAG: LPS export ABC transporter permease LptG [Deltaproteobacteria bacterium]|nr:LPS export ABC transporter permease LptG [Deltaproteobacteria bacterium]
MSLRVRTLDRYVAAQFLRMFFLCLASFIVIYLLVDFIERSSQLLKNDPGTLPVLLYFVYKMPLIVFQMIPVACLLGSLLSLTLLARHSELTAIKAGGIPLLRATASILILSGAISAAGFAMNEYVVPVANQKKEYVYKVNIKKHEWRVKYRKANVYYRTPDAIFSFALFVPEQNKIAGVGMYRFDARFHLVERAIAERAHYDGGWRLDNGTSWRFENGRVVDTRTFDELPVDLRETPEDMKIYQKDAEQMGYRELKAFVRDLERQGYDAAKYKVDLQGKLAFPLVPIIMAMLGIPFAARVGRSGGVALGIGIAVVIGVAYWIVLGLGLALGHAGTLPPFLAAWGSHVLFGAGGFAALLRVRQ